MLEARRKVRASNEALKQVSADLDNRTIATSRKVRASNEALKPEIRRIPPIVTLARLCRKVRASNEALKPAPLAHVVVVVWSICRKVRASNEALKLSHRRQPVVGGGIVEK